MIAIKMINKTIELLESLKDAIANHLLVRAADEFEKGGKSE